MTCDLRTARMGAKTGEFSTTRRSLRTPSLSFTTLAARLGSFPPLIQLITPLKGGHWRQRGKAASTTIRQHHRIAVQ
jgi:hypothetical protein